MFPIVKQIWRTDLSSEAFLNSQGLVEVAEKQLLEQISFPVQVEDELDAFVDSMGRSRLRYFYEGYCDNVEPLALRNGKQRGKLRFLFQATELFIKLPAEEGGASAYGVVNSSESMMVVLYYWPMDELYLNLYWRSFTES